MVVLDLRRRPGSARRACPSGAGCGSRGAGRCATKQVIPLSVWASVKKTSKTGWVQNHLWPVSSNQPSPIGSATVELARRSEPPCFSVKTIPAWAKRVVVGQRQPLLPLRRQRRVLAHRRDGGVVDRHRAARPGVELVEEVEHARPHDVRTVRGSRATAASSLRARRRGAASSASRGRSRSRRRGCRSGRGSAAPGCFAGRAWRARAPRRRRAIPAEVRTRSRPQLTALALERLLQGGVGVKRVVVRKRRGLVGDAVGDPPRLGYLGGAHGCEGGRAASAGAPGDSRTGTEGGQVRQPCDTAFGRLSISALRGRDENSQ